MKSVALFWLQFGVLFLMTGMAYAQVACPPGTVPYGTGQDQSVCGPDDNQQPPEQQRIRPPPPIWVDKYGAIATDFSHSSAGASVDQPDRSSAEQAAIANCQENGGSACKIETWYSNGCATLVVANKTHVSINAATVSEATTKGMKMCVDGGDTKCHVYYTACSLPVRVQ